MLPALPQWGGAGGKPLDVTPKADSAGGLHRWQVGHSSCHSPISLVRGTHACLQVTESSRPLGKEWGPGKADCHP